MSFRKYIEENRLNDYDKVFVTDLALYDPALTIVAESNLKDKFLVFDHHKKAIDTGMNRFTFTKIVENDESGKRCGTDLFYEYLINNNLISKTKALDTFVGYTRLEDTWDWKKVDNGRYAHDLAILFKSIGINSYISTITKKLISNINTFKYTDEELIIIYNKKKI